MGMLNRTVITGLCLNEVPPPPPPPPPEEEEEARGGGLLLEEEEEEAPTGATTTKRYGTRELPCGYSSHADQNPQGTKKFYHTRNYTPWPKKCS